MTRRLTITFALVALAAVTLTTVLTVLVGAVRARTETVRATRAAAAQLAELPLGATTGRTGVPNYCSIAGSVRALRVDIVTCVGVATDGTLTPVTVGAGRALAFPRDVLPDRVALDRLAAGATESGAKNRKAWAIAALRPTDLGSRESYAVVVVRDIENPAALLGIRWLVLSGLVTAAAGAGAALVLARRLSAPLRRAIAATHQLAVGNLEVRLPLDEHADPDDDLAELSRSINLLGESLERSKALEQRFLLSVSHDLRTPLTSIRGYADALADGTLTDVAKGAAVIQRESNRLERLVRDLLDLAKLDARSFRFELQALDLGSVAGGIVDALGPDAERAGLQLQLAEHHSVAVVGDVDRLAQVVANLVENALKFAISAVVVQVSVDPDDARFGLLRISDDGPGIAAEDLPHVFERLYVSKRVPTRKEAGSGLGLAIVRELVEAMGGQVAVFPTAPPGRGTTFAVRLTRSAGG